MEILISPHHIVQKFVLQHLFKETFCVFLDEMKLHEFTHGLVLLLGGKPLFLDPRHVEDVGLRQSFLNAVELLLPEQEIKKR